MPEDAFERYSRQSVLVAELLSIFDSSPEDVSRVMALMQEMQRCGAPPAEIMRDIAPDLQLGPDGMPLFPSDATLPPELAQGCAQQ